MTGLFLAAVTLCPWHVSIRAKAILSRLGQGPMQNWRDGTRTHGLLRGKVHAQTTPKASTLDAHERRAIELGNDVTKDDRMAPRSAQTTSASRELFAKRSRFPPA